MQDTQLIGSPSCSACFGSALTGRSRPLLPARATAQGVGAPIADQKMSRILVHLDQKKLHIVGTFKHFMNMVKSMWEIPESSLVQFLTHVWIFDLNHSWSSCVDCRSVALYSPVS